MLAAWAMVFFLLVIFGVGRTGNTRFRFNKKKFENFFLDSVRFSFGRNFTGMKMALKIREL